MRWWDSTLAVPLPSGVFRYVAGRSVHDPNSGRPEPLMAVYGREYAPGSLYGADPQLEVDQVGPSVWSNLMVPEQPDPNHVGIPVKPLARVLPPSLERTLWEALCGLLESSQILGQEALRNLVDLATSDRGRVGRDLLLVEQLWGVKRSWRLDKAPSTELALRIPSLLGCVSLGHLEEAAGLVYGTAATVRELSSEEALSIDAPSMDMRSRLRFSPGGAEKVDVDAPFVPRARPGVIGPAPLVSPVVEIVVDDEVDTDPLGYVDIELATSEPAAVGLGRRLRAMYLAPHVHMRLRLNGETYDSWRL